ncbi:MAG: hypothetical protein ACI4SL_01625 [Candidatus Ornithospirochaeta sp.]
MNRKWKLYVMHHSHTDIGYTERQEKLERYHSDYIKQAIDIIDNIHNSKRDLVFRWQVENYWQVENFLKNADDKYRDKFESYVKSGEIGLSGNYLNLTDLVDRKTLDTRLEKMKSYGDNLGIEIKCAMTADINGVSWAYGDALYNNGVRYYYSALHPHHGMFPLGRKNMAFRWKTPSGKELLVWNGEHYHFGNELFLSPYAGASYMFLDEYWDLFNEHLMLNDDRKSTLEREKVILKTRVVRHLENMEKEGYEYDILPVFVSGALTDNGFPSIGEAERLKEMNKEFGGEVEFIPATLDMFFSVLEERIGDLPVYSGDWTDWWADGVGSTPMAVKTVKSAERKLDVADKLAAMGHKGDERILEEARQDVIMYSEHTWGYSSSVIEPWDTLVGALDQRKSAYAINAERLTSEYMDSVLKDMGECAIRYQRPQRFRVVNPHKEAIRMAVLLYIELWEYMDGVQFSERTPFEIYDEKTGEVIPHQLKKISRAYQIEVVLRMKAGEERILGARRKKNTGYAVTNFPVIGAERVADVFTADDLSLCADRFETDYFVVTSDDEHGISSIIDKETGSDIIDHSQKYSPFMGIYEVTDGSLGQVEVRRQMGRNRKSSSTERYVSALKSRKVVEKGDVYTTLELNYELEGTDMYSVFWKIYKEIPQIDVMVRVHKTSQWNPENLYAAMPFTVDGGYELYFDKAGVPFRPGIDQLPYSCKMFYLIENAAVLRGEKRSLTITTKDVPLVWQGDLEAKPVVLTESGIEENRRPIYSWIMNNFWETNFRVDLAGFYEFS